MNKPTKIIIGIIVAIIVIGGVWYGVNEKPKVQVKEETIKIGAILPLTGKDSSTAGTAKEGLLLAVELINKSGGVGGRKIEVILEDSQSDQTKAITAFNKLIFVDKVQVVIGGFTSMEAAVLAPLAQSNKRILFSPTATTLILNKAGDYVFKFREGIDIQGKKITEVMQKLGIKKLAVIYNDTEIAHDLMNTFPQEAETRGIEIVAVEKYTPKDIDFRTQLTKIKSKKPEAIYIIGYPKDTPMVVKQARELGLQQQIFSINSAESSVIFEIAGPAAEGIIFTTSPLNCKYEIEPGKTFCDIYKEKYGKDPDYRAAYLYDSLMIVVDAINKVGNDAEELKTQLLKTDFNGAVGKTTFDSDGNAQREVIVKTIKNGKFVPYEK
jgi:branched-chain amino acid transport system substrate-binding protein